ncbi:MAG TPA: hypothetical protein ENN69_04475, partial [Spirochaetia bacterium]|nr:hypothetical protein [Spirochaetia bacterium]
MIIIAIVFVIFVALFLFRLFSGGEKEPRKKKKKKIKVKDRNKIIRETNRRLAQNPKDPDALQALADLYYTEGIYDKSLNYYNTLVGLCASNPDLNEFEMTLRYALSALKLGNYDEAYKSLIIARSFEENNFEL